MVDTNGKPLSGVKVVAIQEEPLKGYEKFETKTKGDGSFVFKGLYPKSVYYLSPEGGQCNYVKKEIDTGPAGETKILKDHIVLKFSPFKVSNDGFITDSRTGLEWAPAPNEYIDWERASQYARSLSLAGGGWRLPTRSELRGLYESGKHGCGIGDEFLNGSGAYSPDYSNSRAWSSEWDDSSSSRAWTFNFATGTEGAHGADRRLSHIRALAVRSQR